MPILEKAPHKMAAKPPSSEEESVSDFWSSLLHPCSPYSHTLASRTVLCGTSPQPCTLQGMKSRLQSCCEPTEEPGNASKGWEWFQGMLMEF